MPAPRTALVGLMLAFLSAARADFSVQQTTRVTGGSILRLSGLLGGRLTAPIKATVTVKGDKMAHQTDAATEIVDLAAQTITTVNPEVRTFRVTSFDQSQTARVASTEVSGLKVEIANAKGGKRLLDQNTIEKILTVSLAVKDTRSGKQSDARIESDMFLARRIPGAEELRHFYTRMTDVAWAPGGMPGVNREMTEALLHAYRGSKQLDGLPLLTRLTVNGVIPGVPAPRANEALMEMTVEVIGWSNTPVDEAIFRIPAGYKMAPREPSRETGARH